MDADDFKVGDVVTLRSGGPKMMIETIAQWKEDERVKSARCMWFTGSSKETGVFKLEDLVQAE